MKNSTLFDTLDDANYIDNRINIINKLANSNYGFINDSHFTGIMNNLPIIYFACSFLFFFIAYILFVNDQELDLLSFYSTTKKGINQIWIEKALVLTVFISIFMLFICSIIILFLLFDNFQLGIPIQFIFGYSNFMYNTTAFQLLILSFVHYFIVSCLLIILFLIIYQLIKNTTLT